MTDHARAVPPASQAGAGGLQPIGLSLAEEAAYELVIDHPDATLAELSLTWNRREQLDVVLANLQVRGIIRALPGSTVRYAVTSPLVALEALVLEEEQRLRAARSHARRLADLYSEHGAGSEPASLVEVVTGQRAVNQRLEQIQRRARTQIRCLDKAGYAVEQESALLMPHLVPDEVTVRIVLDRASVENGRAAPGQRIRVLPGLPMSMLLADDSCAVLQLRNEAGSAEAAVVVHSCALFDALGNLFEGLWRRAIPLDLPDAAGASRWGGGLTSEDRRRLVALLLSGLTDEAIARQLGLGHRTVQRRIAALIGDLGVRTRFQAGVKAAFLDLPDRPRTKDGARAADSRSCGGS